MACTDDEDAVLADVLSLVAFVALVLVALAEHPDVTELVEFDDDVPEHPTNASSAIRAQTKTVTTNAFFLAHLPIVTPSKTLQKCNGLMPSLVRKDLSKHSAIISAKRL